MARIYKIGDDVYHGFDEELLHAKTIIHLHYSNGAGQCTFGVDDDVNLAIAEIAKMMYKYSGVEHLDLYFSVYEHHFTSKIDKIQKLPSP